MAITSKIAFVGLTHLGLNHLAATAKKGYKVMGFDLDKNKIELLNEFSIKYEEKNLKNTLKNCKKKKKNSNTINNDTYNTKYLNIYE